jgi:hypothetical protein
VFQGPADIGKVAINLYSSLPEREQTFASKCLDYRDVRVGNPKQEKNRLGEIFMRKTPVELLQSSFTAIHIFSTGCFEGHSQCDLGRIWTDDGLLATLNSWEPLQWSKGELEWRGDWRLKKRFDSEGLLLSDVDGLFCKQYIHFSARGIIEAVDSTLHSFCLSAGVFPAERWEYRILRILPALLKALKLTGGGTPVAICLSIHDSSFEYMKVSYDPDALVRKKADVGGDRPGISILTLPPAILSNFDEDLQTLMKPCFDALARAGGLPASPRYAK